MPEFDVVFAATQQPMPGLVFTNPSLASGFVKRFNGASPQKVRLVKRPDPVKPDPKGYENGTYIRTPWHQEHWRNVRLYEHVVTPTTGPKLIRYLDVDTQQWAEMAPGRALTTNYSRELNAKNIEMWAQLVNAPPLEIKIARTAEEIYTCYTEGPSSCMGYEYPGDWYRIPCHPSAVYASPDLGVLYTEDSRGRINSRTLVWPDKKRYGRIYAGVRSDDDEHSNKRTVQVAIQNWFHQNGWQNGLEGARILKIPTQDDGTWVMPYLDYSENSDGTFKRCPKEPDKYWVLTQNGPNNGQSTDGRFPNDDYSDDEDYEPETTACNLCHVEYDVDDEQAVMIDNGFLYVCPTCISQHPEFVQTWSEGLVDSSRVEMTRLRTRFGEFSPITKSFAESGVRVRNLRLVTPEGEEPYYEFVR